MSTYECDQSPPLIGSLYQPGMLDVISEGDFPKKLSKAEVNESIVVKRKRNRFKNINWEEVLDFDHLENENQIFEVDWLQTKRRKKLCKDKKDEWLSAKVNTQQTFNQVEGKHLTPTQLVREFSILGGETNVTQVNNRLNHTQNTIMGGLEQESPLVQSSKQYELLAGTIIIDSLSTLASEVKLQDQKIISQKVNVEETDEASTHDEDLDKLAQNDNCQRTPVKEKKKRGRKQKKPTTCESASTAAATPDKPRSEQFCDKLAFFRKKAKVIIDNNIQAVDPDSRLTRQQRKQQERFKATEALVRSASALEAEGLGVTLLPFVVKAKNKKLINRLNAEKEASTLVCGIGELPFETPNSSGLVEKHEDTAEESASEDDEDEGDEDVKRVSGNQDTLAAEVPHMYIRNADYATKIGRKYQASIPDIGTYDQGQQHLKRLVLQQKVWGSDWIEKELLNTVIEECHCILRTWFGYRRTEEQAIQHLLGLGFDCQKFQTFLDQNQEQLYAMYGEQDDRCLRKRYKKRGYHIQQKS